jgi:hypothetical protein
MNLTQLVTGRGWGRSRNIRPQESLVLYNYLQMTLYFSVLRIRDVWFIPDPNFFHPGSALKNLGILTQKLFLSSRKYDPGCSSRIQGSKRPRIRIRNTDILLLFSDASVHCEGGRAGGVGQKKTAVQRLVVSSGRKLEKLRPGLSVCSSSKKWCVVVRFSVVTGTTATTASPSILPEPCILCCGCAPEKKKKKWSTTHSRHTSNHT